MILFLFLGYEGTTSTYDDTVRTKPLNNRKMHLLATFDALLHFSNKNPQQNVTSSSALRPFIRYLIFLRRMVRSGCAQDWELRFLVLKRVFQRYKVNYCMDLIDCALRCAIVGEEKPGGKGIQVWHTRVIGRSEEEGTEWQHVS